MLNPTDHQYWMQQALLLAEKAEAAGEVPVGAILVKDNEILGQGFNQPIFSCDPTSHAEIIAMREAGKKIQNYRLVDTTMYVTLEPCAMCAMAMVHARIKTVVFATSEPRTGAGGSLYQLLQHAGHNHQIEIVEGVLQQQSAEMLKRFFKARR
ncbi:tRNA adenosine(34) deaminase TadA [Aliikangiella coralliicola]|uniref:tRNA-specific adenosine deaminase n=1 Tax=Aliikangiella coralliicola TaxID=2592383 RepID=A0A545TWD5_9GAMM|nr:tRNA adenosine(34) deaminase TadA [Aliikangiella coralliicola]TQV81530.1 tRNA adenosine(34) deaminase TadA [Aliikangiella coralliicola]